MYLELTVCVMSATLHPMKKFIISALMLLACFCWCVPQVTAQDAEVPQESDKKTEKTSKKKKSTANLSPVAKALAEAGYFTETEARPKARTYIFICSASWCGPCRALMPRIVEEYEKNMKKNKSVSLVLLCYDRTEDEARKYIEHYKTDMPGVMFKSFHMENVPSIDSIPSCFYMNAKGELISMGSGDKVLNWKTEMKKKPEKKKRK